MIALHMGGIPELAMVLGPILLIFAFVRIARRNDATAAAEDDAEDWDPDLGDLDQSPEARPERQPVEGRVSGARPSSS